MDFVKAVEMIRAAESVVITTHTRPDGDALGSVAALCEMILALAAKEKRRVRVQPLILSEPAESYGFLVREGTWILGRDITPEQVANGRLGDFDLAIVVDTAATRQLPEGVGEWLRDKARNLLVIDHHISGDIEGHHRLVDTTAAAAGEIVYWLSKRGPMPLSEKAAGALFSAISTDTGWFRFSNTSADTLMIAADLIHSGADPADLYRRLFESNPIEKVRLTATTVDTLQLHHRDRLATMQITQEMFKQTGTDRTHVENIVNIPLQVGSVQAVVLLVQIEEQVTRCSFRSKDVIDVNAVAGSFGGGGHKHAAGATLKLPIEQARQEVIAAFESIM